MICRIPFKFRLCQNHRQGPHSCSSRQQLVNCGKKSAKHLICWCRQLKLASMTGICNKMLFCHSLFCHSLLHLVLSKMKFVLMMWSFLFRYVRYVSFSLIVSIETCKELQRKTYVSNVSKYTFKSSRWTFSISDPFCLTVADVSCKPADKYSTSFSASTTPSRWRGITTRGK